MTVTVEKKAGSHKGTQERGRSPRDVDDLKQMPYVMLRIFYTNA